MDENPFQEDGYASSTPEHRPAWENAPRPSTPWSSAEWLDEAIQDAVNAPTAHGTRCARCMLRPLDVDGHIGLHCNACARSAYEFLGSGRLAHRASQLVAAVQPLPRRRGRWRFRSIPGRCGGRRLALRSRCSHDGCLPLRLSRRRRPQPRDAVAPRRAVGSRCACRVRIRRPWISTGSCHSSGSNDFSRSCPWPQLVLYSGRAMPRRRPTASLTSRSGSRRSYCPTKYVNMFCMFFFTTTYFVRSVTIACTNVLSPRNCYITCQW